MEELLSPKLFSVIEVIISSNNHSLSCRKLALHPIINFFYPAMAEEDRTLRLFITDPRCIPHMITFNQPETSWETSVNKYQGTYHFIASYAFVFRKKGSDDRSSPYVTAIAQYVTAGAQLCDGRSSVM